MGAHSLGVRHNSGQVCFPLQEIVRECPVDRLPSVGPPSGCTRHCATLTCRVRSEFHAGSEAETIWISDSRPKMQEGSFTRGGALRCHVSIALSSLALLAGARKAEILLSGQSWKARRRLFLARGHGRSPSGGVMDQRSENGLRCRLFFFALRKGKFQFLTSGRSFLSVADTLMSEVLRVHSVKGH